MDLSDDEDTTDLQKCVNFAIAQLRAAGNLDSATFVAVGKFYVAPVRMFV